MDMHWQNTLDATSPWGGDGKRVRMPNNGRFRFADGAVTDVLYNIRALPAIYNRRQAVPGPAGEFNYSRNFVLINFDWRDLGSYRLRARSPQTARSYKARFDGSLLSEWFCGSFFGLQNNGNATFPKSFNTIFDITIVSGNIYAIRYIAIKAHFTHTQIHAHIYLWINILSNKRLINKSI